MLIEKTTQSGQKNVLKSGFYFNTLLENFKIYAKFAKSFFYAENIKISLQKDVFKFTVKR